jgi:hypothetical protein
MRSRIRVLLLFIPGLFITFLSGCATQGVKEGGGRIVNIEAAGNLESTHDLSCVSETKLHNQYTPSDLYRAVARCVENGDYEKAVMPFAMAGVYGRYDTRRVADSTAHQAIYVLWLQVFNGFSTDQQQAFKKTLQANLGVPSKLVAVCDKLKSIGTPNYYPRYMVQHGMEAFNPKPGDNGLVKDFDSKAAWQFALDSYLHCPKK